MTGTYARVKFHRTPLLLSNLSQLITVLSQQQATTVQGRLENDNVPRFENFDESKETFTAYRQRFENFLTMKQLIGSKPEIQRAMQRVLIQNIGVKHYNLPASLTVPDLPNTKSYDVLVELLENHQCPRPNDLIEQHRFLSHMQGPNESVAKYIAELRKLTTTCNFTCPDKKCKKSIAA